jgi:hypothetical protein
LRPALNSSQPSTIVPLLLTYYLWHNPVALWLDLFSPLNLNLQCFLDLKAGRNRLHMRFWQGLAPRSSPSLDRHLELSSWFLLALDSIRYLQRINIVHVAQL